MKFVFDLQRFDAEISDGKVTIPAGETFTLDDVIYTAGSSGAATLNLDSDGKVSGIASGSVTATLDGASDSAAITFDGSTPFDFTALLHLTHSTLAIKTVR